MVSGGLGCGRSRQYHYSALLHITMTKNLEVMSQSNESVQNFY